MNLCATFHNSTDNFCYMVDENKLMLNIKTGYDIDKIYIYYDDPYKIMDTGKKERFLTNKCEITDFIRLHYHKLWSFTIEPEFKRCIYYFELISKNETYFYFENRFISKEDFEINTSVNLQCFCFPWMNNSDIYTVPSWVNDTVWYQIFPDRFYRSLETKIDAEVLPWGNLKQKLTNQDLFGGNLKGINEKLDYLVNLGISGIYLTPITESPTVHRYDVTDYYKIDPRLGTDEDLIDLVNEAHKRNMKVMMDGVFNHCGTHFAPWQDVVKNGPKSKYFDWFFVHKWPFDKTRNARNGNYYTFSFHDVMPKLNTNNKEVVDYFVNVCKHYINTYNIDGLRLDVANEISHSFCKTLRSELKKIKPDFYLLGEIWNNSLPWLRGDEFDSVMNYPLTYAFQNYWTNTIYNKEDLELSINECYSKYTIQTNSVIFNLLDSHDTKRLASSINNKDKCLQMLTLMMAMPGTPCIFYGTEILLKGNEDPDCRKCMPWDLINKGKYDNTLHKIQKIIKLRNEEKLFKGSNYYFTNDINNDRVIEFVKKNSNNEYIKIILNCSDKNVEIDTKENIIFSNLYNRNVLKVNGILIVRG